HPQTAFAMGLAIEAARRLEDFDLTRRLADLAKRFFAACRTDLSGEPSGHDFLSPVLGEADVMSMILAEDEFAAWWQMPQQLPDWHPVDVVDAEDGHLVHFAGLNLSRAWMLSAIAKANPTGAEELTALSRAHAEKGLSQIEDDSYAGAHWLGTFAVYKLHRETGPFNC